MQYLNILYFVIITLMAWNFLQSDGKIVKGALNRDERYHYSGVELFWCLTFSTGLLAFSANVGLDLMAIRLLVLEVLCVIGMVLAKHRPILSVPLVIYIVFLLWMVVGLFYAPSFIFGIRVILKYLYPLLLCLFASAAVRHREVFFKSSFFARWIGVVSIAFTFIPFIGKLFPGVFWYGTAEAINYISMMIFSLGMVYFSNKKKQNIIFTILFMLPCLIWVFRTSIMGSVVAIAAFSFIRYRVQSLPIIGAIAVLAICSVFFIPAVRDKMFYHKNFTIEDFMDGKVSRDDINTNYRDHMWKILQKKYYEPHKIVGSGTGVAQAEMYLNSAEYGDLKIIHSDFVQQKCDNGLVGLCLYGLMVFCIFGHAFKTYWTARSGTLQLCAIVTGASILGVYATFYSDNVVNYSMATLSMPFGFYGMMLGLKRREEFRL